MSSKRRCKWKTINERVKKHFLTLETEEKNKFKESITANSKESLNSVLLEHCSQQFNEYEFFFDGLSEVENINEDENINSNYTHNTDNESDSSCSSIEYYLLEDDFDEIRSTKFEDSNDNNAEFSINNSLNVLTNSIEDISNLASNLTLWALEHKISHTALNSLLRILQKYNLIAFSDARTLLKTSRNTSVFNMCNGKYCYFGIANSLQTLFSKVPLLKSLQQINLFVNIDGLPLANSSSVQFWPILCKIDQSLCHVDPLIVAVFCGQSKPLDVHEYLKDFIQEYKNLRDFGLIIDAKLYSVTISGFICDAPARAFVKVIKGHTSFYSCERCTQKGIHPFGATLFNEVDAEIRTDQSFLQQTQLEHHNGISPLTEINFPMVTKFILDSMHLVYLGVMRRILFQMVQGNNYFCKLDRKRISLLSERLESLHKYIPVDFARKPQSLHKIQKWKATELRQFLLYTGLYVLNGIIPSNHIEHFKIFHTAIYILSHPYLAVQLCNYAQALLIEFVKTFNEFFGPNSKIYNVHNLVHLPDDVRNFNRSLDEISSFDFENLLGKIKRSLRSGKNPLSQLARRLSEKSSICEKYISNWQLKRKHKCGPLVTGLESSVSQYKEIIIDKFHFVICHKSDRYALLKNGNIVQIFNIVLKDSEEINPYFICKQFTKYNNYFCYPCESQKLKICRMYKLEDSFRIINLSELEAKCIVFEDNISYIAYPLLHTITT